MTQSSSDRSFYRNYYREIDVLHGLQSAPEERDWLLTTPKGDVKPSEIVLYLGCNVLRTTHLVRTVMDVFKLLDVDFTAVGGASYCCGIQHFQRGDTASARSVAETTAANFRKFDPEQVVMWCPSCIFFYDDIMDMREEFTFQHVTEFLVQNLHRLDFQSQPETTLSLHYHTGRPQSEAEARSALTLCRSFPASLRWIWAPTSVTGGTALPQCGRSSGRRFGTRWPGTRCGRRWTPGPIRSPRYTTAASGTCAGWRRTSRCGWNTT